jgi:hypothetical protein
MNPENKNQGSITIGDNFTGQFSQGDGNTQIQGARQTDEAGEAFSRLNEPERKARETIIKGLRTHFDDPELRLLCADLGIDYDEIPGQTKGEKCLKLVNYFARRQLLDELRDACRQARPGADW